MTTTPCYSATDTEFTVHDFAAFRSVERGRLRWELVAWLERHGIDPNDVPGHATIIRDPERREIRHTSYLPGPKGRRQANPDGTGALTHEVTVTDVDPASFPA